MFSPPRPITILGAILCLLFAPSTQAADTILIHCGNLIAVPGVAIFITVTLLNLVGDGLRDALDPKLRK